MNIKVKFPSNSCYSVNLEHWLEEPARWVNVSLTVLANGFDGAAKKAAKICANLKYKRISIKEIKSMHGIEYEDKACNAVEYRDGIPVIWETRIKLND